MAEERRDQRDTIILGLPFSRLTTTETLDLLERMIRERSRNYVVTANLDYIARAMKDPILKRIVYSAPLVTPDGMPLVWAGKTMTPPLTERVAGSDFVPMLLARAAENGYSVFFFGGREEVALRAADQCKLKYPQLRIAGVYSPPFQSVWEMNNTDMVDRINKAAPDILLVAFGSPKQDYWIAMNYLRLNVPVSIGVGATIDFLSGVVPRAPNWMKGLSAEWLFRLFLEPRRLAKRYAIDVRDGLLPLLVQTAAEVVMRLSRVFSHKDADGTPEVSRLSVKSASAEVYTVLLEKATKRQLALLASNLERFVGPESDALILDLRSCHRIDSDILSSMVSIDRQLRQNAKHCIFVIGTLAKVILHVAKIHDMLITVSDRESALDRLRRIGKRMLNVSEKEVNSEVRILSLQGELTNSSAFLLDDHCHTFYEDAAVIFDFTRIESLDTGGLQYLLDQWTTARGVDNSIHCVTSNKCYASMLQAPGLRSHFFLYPTVDHAVSHIRGAQVQYRAKPRPIVGAEQA